MRHVLQQDLSRNQLAAISSRRWRLQRSLCDFDDLAKMSVQNFNVSAPKGNLSEPNDIFDGFYLFRTDLLPLHDQRRVTSVSPKRRLLADSVEPSGRHLKVFRVVELSSPHLLMVAPTLNLLAAAKPRCRSTQSTGQYLRRSSDDL